MKEKRKTTLRKLENGRKESFYLIIRGLEVGITAGLTCVLYRFLLSFAEEKLMKIITAVSGNPLKIVLWLGILALLGIFVWFIITKWQPLSAGSGIPQVSAELGGYINHSWWRIILAKLVGSTTSVFAGLSLGREGPSIQLGAMAAKGAAKITKADKTTELRMMSCGAGAGLAAAFNAPLGGIMFVLEEIQHTFDKSVLVMGIVAAVVGDYISKFFFGQNTVFNYETENIPLRYYWLLIIFGIILGFSGAAYNTTMMKGQDLFKKIKLPGWLKMALVFVTSGVVGLYMPQILCGGHSMAEYLMAERPAILTMIVLLVAKYVFGVFSFSSGAPGGTLYPLSILGTYLGAIYGSVAIGLFDLNPDLWQEFVVIGMAGFFASIVRAPITGIVIVLEISGNMNSLLPLVVTSLVSYAVAEMLGSTPFYAASLSRVLKNNNITVNEGKIGEKIIQTLVVPTGSKIAGKTVKDIDWGKHCLVVTIERNDGGITPKGDTVIKEGDKIVLLVSQRRFAKDKTRLEKIISSD